MKLFFTRHIKIQAFALSGFFILLSLPSYSGEFLVIDKEITWGISADTSINLFSPASGVPSNWLSPADYFTGTWYIRYEVLSVKTSTAFGMQFGILQHDTGRLYEQPIQQLQGVGDVAIQSSSPSAWLKPGGSVDFSKGSEIQPLCARIYSWAPQLPVDPGQSVWSQRFNWFPVTLRITVVAVSSGSTFSGWADYLNIKKPTPSYSVDYINELTNKSVPSTDEYSHSPGMSGAVSGSGSKLALTPGQDVYFRTKAEGDTLASDIQHLIVPARPATPAITIDYAGEKTTQNITATTEYATTALFTSPIAGTGAKVSLTPGEDLYFRVKATSGNFVSAIQSLDVPARPEKPVFTIDYLHEKTNEPVGSAIEYSTSVSFLGAVTGSGATVTLTPGVDLYFRVKATASGFVSETTLLDIPARSTSPSISINYMLEKTSQPIPTSMEYSTETTFAVSSTGSGSTISVTPEQNLYFRYKATSTAFSSNAFLLVVAKRPDIPTASINYTNETTVQSFPASIVYSKSPTFSAPISCTGTPIALTPGQDLYIWVKATNSSFASHECHLVVPGRPATTIAFTIDYINEKTNENVGSTIEYSASESFTDKNTGSGNKITLTPGQAMYFREKATAGVFASEYFFLDVDARSSAPYILIDYSLEMTSQVITSDMVYSISASFSSSTTGAGNKIFVTAGQDLYFKILATASTFDSEVFWLDVPERPAVPNASIDYLAEKTVESFPETIEYSTSPTYAFPVSCTGRPISLTPGQDLYIWVKQTSHSFASMDYHLVVPERPSISFAFTVDYGNEKTTENVGTDIEYSVNGYFDDAIDGTGEKVILIPGQDLYFRMKASTGSFASEAYFLAVDDRPSTPSVSINYFTEYTNETISSDMAYSADSTFAVSSAGTGSKITVAPGKDLYFKVKATSGNFASGVYFLTIPERPATPTATINYTAEATVESFPATVEYSKSPTYSAPISCTGTPIVLTPGQDLWIWVKPTLASFASMDYHLVVPERPYLEYTGDAIVNTSFSVKAILQDLMTGFDLADILVTNGQAENLRNDNSFDVVPDQKGDVHVVISINSFGGASFASNEVMVYYDSTLSAIPRMDKDSYTVYPNPSHDGIFNIRTMVNAPYTIDVISPEGSIIKSIIAGETECQQIDLQGLPKGMFYLRIRANEKVHIHKVIME